MRHLAGCLLVLLCGSAWASEPVFETIGVGGWDEVTDIQRRAQAAGSAGYQTSNGTWHLAPDGRMAVLYAREGRDGTRTAMLGRYELQGPWLAVELERTAVDVASLNSEQRAEYDHWQAINLAAQQEAEAAAEPGDASVPATNASADPEVGPDAEASAVDPAVEAFRRPRYLRVPYRGGELLVREQFLPMMASRWNGKEPLELFAEAWRLPAAATPSGDEDEATFRIDDPLRAGLPHELARLLRVDAVEARVVEVLGNVESLRWKRQRAKVRVQLDRGELAGLFVGMSLRGLPPDEEFSGEIVSAEPGKAQLELQVTRFAPGDLVALPPPGVRFTTRSERGACGIDTSVALRAKVETVATPAELVQWDEEGYAWFELRLDQGAAQGLAVGDRLHAEDDEIDGEGRVVGVASRHATVQWRAQRYSQEIEVRLPAAGDALVTPAWQRAEWDVFGAATRH